MKKAILSAVILLIGFAAQAQLTITESNNGANLANSLVGTGTNIQNVVLTCPSTASGSFSGGMSAGLGIGNGLVLSSGMVSAIADSAAAFASAVFAASGDPALDSIVGVSTYDACVLEFDVNVAGDTLMIDFVFGSEEYPEFECSGFNDIFAFQLSGPNPAGGSYEHYNIARLPNGETVGINTVNSGSGMGCDSNIGYYVDNTGSIDVVFDGYTVPLTATTPTVAGQTYHMRFAIGDAGDGAFDSAVFLKSGSLKSAQTATGIATLGSTALSSVKPNPTSGATILENKMDKLIDYAVLNMMGQTLLKGSVGAGSSLTIDLSVFGTGHYFVRSSSGAVVTTQRIEVR